VRKVLLLSQNRYCATLKNGSTKPYFGGLRFSRQLRPSLPHCGRGTLWYNCRMTQALQDVFAALRELPDDEQDTIADRLMQLMDLASLHED